MSKRSSNDKIEYYQAKIQKLQQREVAKNQRRRRVVIYSDSSQSDENSDHELPSNDAPDQSSINEVSVNVPLLQPEHCLTETPLDAEVQPPEPEQSPGQDASPVDEPNLDADFLSALGDTVDEESKYGERIHQDLAQRWLPVLRRGMPKEVKDRLLKEYAAPENCKLLKAPSLNPEISAAITEVAKVRDKKLESIQQQLGLGITAVNKAMSLIMTGDDKQSKVQAIKMLSDGCRILSDLHYTETRARMKLITPNLDKTFLNIIQDVERDEYLFGSKLSEKIKASKTIEKQGLQIKKAVVTSKTSTPSTPQTPAVPRYQGNWKAPSHYQPPSNRGGRGGAQRNPSSSSSYKRAPAQTKPAPHSKHRVPPRQ